VQEVVRCVTYQPLRYSTNYKSAEPPLLVLGNGDPVPLPGPGRISLTFAMHYAIVRATGRRGPWRTSTRGYLYGLDDADGHEILGYHWHPYGRSPETRPHLHLGAGAGVRRPELTSAHLPTGRIAIEDVLRMTITDFGVQPLRADWQQVLAESQAAFERSRT